MSNLFITCCLVWLISLILFRRNIVSPSSIISFGFTMSSFFLLFYKKIWNFKEQKVSHFIILSLIFFIFGACLVSIIFHVLKKRKISVDIQYVSISKWKLIVYLCFQLCLYFCILIYIFQKIGMPSNFKDFSSVIGLYYDLNKSGEIPGLPGFLNILKILNISGIYLICYIFVNNYFCTKKINIYVILNIFIGILGSLLTGTKTEMTLYIIGILVMWVLFSIRRNGTISIFSFGDIVKLVVLIALGIIAFNILSILQGRMVEGMTSKDILATYLAAPIKNLEIFMNTHERISLIFGGETFLDTYRWIYDLTKNSTYFVPSLYDYQWINGSALGNVYTLLMPLYNDFGYLGTYFMMILLGAFSQFIMEKAIFTRQSKINYFIIFYAYLAYAIFFSFFSNKFFEMIISRSGVYFLIGLFIWKVLLIDDQNNITEIKDEN